MNPRDRSVRHVHPQLIGGEVVGTFRYGVQATQRAKHGLVEPFAGFQIRHTQMNVVYQPATVEFHVPSDVVNVLRLCSSSP